MDNPKKPTVPEVMFAPSKCSLTAMPSPAEPQRMVLPGATMIWDMDGAAMSFSISVLIAWSAPTVTSMSPKIQTVGFGCKPERICSRCFRKFP